MSHTPGPWSILKLRADGWNYLHGEIESHLGRIAKDADARLIAAAPELLEACIQAEAAMTIVRPSSDAPEYRRILGVLRDALKKARGE